MTRSPGRPNAAAVDGGLPQEVQPGVERASILCSTSRQCRRVGVPGFAAIADTAHAPVIAVPRRRPERASTTIRASGRVPSTRELRRTARKNRRHPKTPRGKELDSIRVARIDKWLRLPIVRACRRFPVSEARQHVALPPRALFRQRCRKRSRPPCSAASSRDDAPSCAPRRAVASPRRAAARRLERRGPGEHARCARRPSTALHRGRRELVAPRCRGARPETARRRARRSRAVDVAAPAQRGLARVRPAQDTRSSSSAARNDRAARRRGRRCRCG